MSKKTLHRQLADEVREKNEALNRAITEAYKHGLEVEVRVFGGPKKGEQTVCDAYIRKVEDL